MEIDRWRQRKQKINEIKQKVKKILIYFFKKNINLKGKGNKLTIVFFFG